MIKDFIIRYWILNREGIIFVGSLFFIIFYFFFLRGNKYEKR